VRLLSWKPVACLNQQYFSEIAVASFLGVPSNFENLVVSFLKKK
jgi:hypothetical protein